MQHSKNIERPLRVRSDARRSMAGEFDSIASLAVRAWRTAAGDVAIDGEKHLALQSRFLRDLRENADGVLVAEQAGVVLGWGARVPASNYISDLWIDPLYHGQGIGGRILDALMAQILLDGLDEALIGTHADNRPAIGLYEKAGFKIDWRGEEWSESFGRTVEKVRLRARLR